MILLWLIPAGTDREAPVESSPEPSAPPAREQAPAPRDETPGEALAAARQKVRDLELALGAAVEERKRAETLMEQSEQDVEELERFIERIEERGEDPVDYADEGLQMFQPAFYAYQEALSRLEQAEASEAALREELAAAESRLAVLEEAAGER
jgi:hypothetical protein